MASDDLVSADEVSTSGPLSDAYESNFDPLCGESSFN